MADGPYYLNPQVPVVDKGGILSLPFYRFLLRLGGSLSAAPSGGIGVVTMVADPSIPDARVLTAGSNLTVTDAGAGSTVTVALRVSGAASVLLGRGSSGAGAFQELTLGTGLSLSGTVLSSSTATGDDALTVAWLGL
tara:strand:- start:307 stop:717 length:411 start_codon:yes stop_codon:yes gene_type:complete